MKRAWKIAAVTLFVLTVFATKKCGEWLDAPLVAVEPDRTNWKPCPDRKPVKVNGRKQYWYCGPGETENPGGGASVVDARPAKGRPEKRATGRRSQASGGG